MTTEDYRGALTAAIREYEELGATRRDVDRRLAHLAQTIGTLSRLLGLTPTVPLGLTDACRLVLRSGLPMTPVEIRDRLLGIGVDLSIYSSELSAIHTVLKRLNDAGEIRLGIGLGKRFGFRQPGGKDDRFPDLQHNEAFPERLEERSWNSVLAATSAGPGRGPD